MRQALFLFDWKPIGQSYLPGRGLACSAIVHGLILCGLPFIPLHGKNAELPRVEQEIAYINLKDPNDVLYLPTLVHDDPVSAPSSEGSKASSPERIRTSVSKSKGFSYPGPQFIESDFPEPTNSILTVLQPAIANPQILRPPLMLPNIVQMPAVSAPPLTAPSKLVDPSLLAEVQVSSNPDLQLAAKPFDLPSKLAPSAIPNRIEPKEPVPAQPVSKPVEPLLVVTPMPAPRPETLSIPSGEARGRFSISPDASGSKSDTPAASASPATELAPAANAAASSKDKNPPAAGTASGTGRGNSNAFPGITILGGPSDTGNNKSSANIISIGTAPPPLQTSYGITIVSTEGSGGGLPQYGVFTNEQIFTVYLDMRRTVSDPVPSWTFEYAVLKETNSQPTPPISPGRAQQGLVLPFPTLKEQPALPADLVRKYQRLRLIVYAVINTDGKMEQISVKESPDSLLNAPVLSALSKWAFRPAQLNGEKVSVKVLIGIPLS